MSGSGGVRLDRLLANLGYGSRSEVKALLAGDRVRMGGQSLADPGRRLRLDNVIAGQIEVDGAPLDPPAPLTLVVHKPLGLVCSHNESGRSVYDLLPPRWRRRSPPLSSIGRLDKDTSGLLLITDDGALLHRVISPRRHLAKRYVVSLERPLTGGEAAMFASGTMVLAGEKDPLAPAALEPLTATVARLILTEGRYHQVRRMFDAIGNRVTALHRDRIGALDLPVDLKPGEWRILLDDERARVLQSAGAAPELQAEMLRGQMPS